MNRRRVRLDSALVDRGLARSHAEAREFVEGGRVLVSGGPARKAATMVSPDDDLHVVGDAPRWASRGGDKLDGALPRLDVDVAGRHALDAGAAHGGFTDVLLSRGAARVIAVDVGYGQLDWRLRNDARVVVRERTNVRLLEAGDLGVPAPDLVVADLSFIALKSVLAALQRVADPHASHVLLCKPQFEAGRGAVDRRGVVREPAVWTRAVVDVVDAARAVGLGLVNVVPSPVRGPAGNVEFFLHLHASGSAGLTVVQDAIAEVQASMTPKEASESCDVARGGPGPGR